VLLACGFVAFSAKASESEITLVQLEAGESDNATALVGHWRKTSFGYGATTDDHLVFRPDGTVDKWALTVAGEYTQRTSRSATTSGRWSIQGKLLNIDWGDTQSSRPFLFDKGKLVLPNIPQARQFWDRIGKSATTSVVPSAPRKDFSAPSSTDESSKARAQIAKLESEIADLWRDCEKVTQEDSFQRAQKIADAGSAEAQFEMGVINEFGFKSSRPDLREAAAWYRKAANQGHDLAKQGWEDLSRSGAALSEFDMLKLDMRRLSRLQRISSNIIARMDELAKEAIRSIREGK
jgi:hypothetical protein